MIRVTKTCDYSIRGRAAQLPRLRRRLYLLRVLKFSTMPRGTWRLARLMSYCDIFPASVGVYHTAITSSFRSVSSVPSALSVAAERLRVAPGYAFPLPSSRSRVNLRRSHTAHFPFFCHPFFCHPERSRLIPLCGTSLRSRRTPRLPGPQPPLQGVPGRRLSR